MIPSSQNTAVQASALRILFATSECAPLVKTGGPGRRQRRLAPCARDARSRCQDPAAGLPPGARPAAGWREIARFPASADLPASRLLLSKMASGVPLLALDCPELYDRPGGPYQTKPAKNWSDNALRFGLLSRVAALLAAQAARSTGSRRCSTATNGRPASPPLTCAMPPARAPRRCRPYTILPFRGYSSRNWSPRSASLRPASPRTGRVLRQAVLSQSRPAIGRCHHDGQPGLCAGDTKRSPRLRPAGTARCPQG